LTINDDFRNQVYLNDYFEYDRGTDNAVVYGKVEYALFDLKPGTYNLKFKVWNIFNKSVEDSLDFEVVQSDKPIIANAYNFPNPCRDYTKFYFTHNAPKKIKQIRIDIFDMGGRFIGSLPKNEEMTPDGFAIKPIEWNLRDAQGNRVPQGLYLYRIRIVLEDGRVAEKTEKLIIGGG